MKNSYSLTESQYGATVIPDPHKRMEQSFGSVNNLYRSGSFQNQAKKILKPGFYSFVTS
jgi:hypothetical protein